MASSKLILANIALQKIGAKKLTTFGETTTAEGIAVSAIYDDIRDEVLEEHPWTFAQKRVALVDITTPSTDSDDWVTSTDYAVGDKVLSSTLNYTCLVAHTSGTFATDLTAGKWILCETPAWTDDGCDVVYYKPTDYLELSETNYPNALIKVEGARILSDTSGLKITYTYSNDDPSTYSKKFALALSTRLAAELCFTLSNSTTKGEALMKLYYDVQLPSAISSDSQQGTPTQARQDEWENIRLSGSSGFLTTGQTWHPQ